MAKDKALETGNRLIVEDSMTQTPEIVYIRDFLSTTEADALLARIRIEGEFKQNYIHLFGRKAIPRLEAWYGDHDYPYSKGVVLIAQPMPGFLLDLMRKVEEAAGEPFNSVLINRYRSGNDYISWHSDNDYGVAEPTIPGVTLGATRRFLLRHKQTKKTVEYAPAHGSLIIMRGRTNEDWMHSVPKQANVQQERVNLTFRRMGERHGK